MGTSVKRVALSTTVICNFGRAVTSPEPLSCVPIISNTLAPELVLLPDRLQTLELPKAL